MPNKIKKAEHDIALAHGAKICDDFSDNPRLAASEINRLPNPAYRAAAFLGAFKSMNRNSLRINRLAEFLFLFHYSRMRFHERRGIISWYYMDIIFIALNFDAICEDEAAKALDRIKIDRKRKLEKIDKEINRPTGLRYFNHQSIRLPRSPIHTALYIAKLQEVRLLVEKDRAPKSLSRLH